MKRKRWLPLVLFAFFISFQVKFDAQNSSAYGKSENSELALIERGLNNAVDDLQGGNYMIVNAAIRFVVKYSDAPGIQRAIDPLEEVLLNPSNRYNAMTRSLAAGALGQIIRNMENNGLKPRATDILIQSLHGDPVDMVRAASASALVFSDTDDVITALLYSMQNDSSILVKEASRLSLVQLKVIEYSPDTQLSTFTALSSDSTRAGTAISEYNAPTEKEIRDYINQHTVILNGNNGLEE